MQRNQIFPDFSAAILAGGKNSRFKGENKSFLKIDNQYVIDKTIAVLQDLFSEVIIVANNREAYAAYSEIKIISDYYKEIGPLGGIHSALKNAKNLNVFIVSCDMPFLDKKLISEQIHSHINSNADVTIPILNDFKEPLHGIYNKTIFPKLENFIQSTDKYKITGFFNLVKVNYFEVIQSNMKAFTNINNPDDYNKLLQEIEN